MLRRNGIALGDVAHRYIRTTLFLVLFPAVFFPFPAVQSGIYEYRDDAGRRIFTNICNEEQLKAGCKKVTWKERPPLSPDEEKNLRALFPKGDEIEQLIKGARERPTKEVGQRILRADINQDGRVTISDLPGWVEWAFYYPGDWVVYILSHRYKKLSGFLELKPMNYGGMFSLLLSTAAWLLLVALCIGVKRATKKFRANRGYQ